MQKPSDTYCNQRPNGSRSPWEIATPEPGCNRQGQPVHREPSGGSGRSSSSNSFGFAGVEITYFSDAQLPRSMSRHRSLQNGIFGSSNRTSLLQMGQRIVAAIELLQPNYPTPIDPVNFLGAAVRMGNGFADLPGLSNRSSGASTSAPTKS